MVIRNILPRKHRKGHNKMKKATIIVTILLLIIGLLLCTNKTYAAEKAIDNSTESRIIELKENATKSLEDYKEKYGSDAYGITAYILNRISIFSIPFCFLGIAISGIYQYIIGIRKLDVKEKGLTMMVTFVTTLVICQILPLAFAIVVKFGRG